MARQCTMLLSPCCLNWPALTSACVTHPSQNIDHTQGLELHRPCVMNASMHTAITVSTHNCVNTKPHLQPTWKLCKSGMSSSGSKPSLLMASLAPGSPSVSLIRPKRLASQYAKSQVDPAGSPARGPKCSSSLWKRGGQAVLSWGALCVVSQQRSRGRRHEDRVCGGSLQCCWSG
jgi:hypothetical protein